MSIRGHFARPADQRSGPGSQRLPSSRRRPVGSARPIFVRHRQPAWSAMPMARPFSRSRWPDPACISSMRQGSPSAERRSTRASTAMTSRLATHRHARQARTPPGCLPTRRTRLSGRCRRLGSGADISAAASTDLRAGFGGLGGRALAAGDLLPLAGKIRSGTRRLEIDTRWIDPHRTSTSRDRLRVRVLPGRDPLREAVALHDSEWLVDAASNRQGLRLKERNWRSPNPSERISEPVMPGTLQLPPDGSPILLLADAQTHGGYPRIAHVIAADMPRLAQLRPGECLRLQPCTHEAAQRLLNEQRQRLARMTIAIGQQPDRGISGQV